MLGTSLKKIFKWSLNGSITLYMWQAETEKLKYLKAMDRNSF